MAHRNGHSSHSYGDGSFRDGSFRESRVSQRSPDPKRARHEPHPLSQDDQDGHLIIHRNDFNHTTFGPNQRYLIKQELGEGTFGKVLLCHDNKYKNDVAVKVIRSIEKYREAASVEFDILSHIHRYLEDDTPIVQLLACFDHLRHRCLVFDVLGMSVYNVHLATGYRPYCYHDTVAISAKVAEALAFLHGVAITHTDLKTENILLIDDHFDLIRENDREVIKLHDTRIKVIDFGSATFDWDHHTSIITTRHYRAPEVILQVGWTHACDIWSLGCITVELLDGACLFQTHDNFEHLAMMEKLLGERLPPHMLKPSCIPAGDAQGRLRWPELAADDQSIAYVADKYEPLERWIPDARAALRDVVRRAMTLDPIRRPSAARLQADFLALLDATTPVPTSDTA